MMDLSRIDSVDALPDIGETVCLSPLALLKMLRHGRAGVPLEVMGLMTGAFIDAYTIQIVDVYSMPQTGTGVTVEAVDPVYQSEMTNLLHQIKKTEDVVGWYHSHPGFGCWLSSTDMSTQESFERLHRRAVAVVVDPIQSVNGRVVCDAFRLINNQFLLTGIEPRAVTSNLGFQHKPSVVALLHGLNRHYYSFRIVYSKSCLEKKMLLNCRKKSWARVLVPDSSSFGNHGDDVGENFHIQNVKEKVQRYAEGDDDLKTEVLEEISEIYNKSIRRNLLKSIHYRIFSK